MISFDSRYFGNAYRISDVPIKSTVTTLYDGQWMKINSDGQAELHDGTSGIKGYMTISSRYGTPANNIGAPITNDPAGRDNVTSTGMVSLLVGPYRIATDQYETDTYTVGTPLTISSNGKLTPFNTSTGKAWDIVGWVFAPPATAGAPMTIVHEGL